MRILDHDIWFQIVDVGEAHIDSDEGADGLYAAIDKPMKSPLRWCVIFIQITVSVLNEF